MKIYFRRATINPSLASSLPDTFIVESVKEDMFNELHAALPGWECLEEVSLSKSLLKMKLDIKSLWKQKK